MYYRMTAYNLVLKIVSVRLQKVVTLALGKLGHVNILFSKQ